MGNVRTTIHGSDSADELGDLAEGALRRTAKSARKQDRADQEDERVGREAQEEGRASSRRTDLEINRIAPR